MILILKLFSAVFGFTVFGLAANADTPLGFRPHGKVLRLRPYLVLSTYATAIKAGSMVELVAAGYVQLAAATNTDNLGVAANAIAASTGGTLWVYDDPEQEFVIQDDAGATLDQGAIGANADFSTESSTTDESNMELAAAGVTTATASLRIIGVAKTRYPDGTENAVGDNCDWIVKINEHTFKSTTGI